MILCWRQHCSFQIPEAVSKFATVTFSENLKTDFILVILCRTPPWTEYRLYNVYGVSKPWYNVYGSGFPIIKPVNNSGIIQNIKPLRFVNHFLWKHQGGTGKHQFLKVTLLATLDSVSPSTCRPITIWIWFISAKTNTLWQSLARSSFATNTQCVIGDNKFDLKRFVYSVRVFTRKHLGT